MVELEDVVPRRDYKLKPHFHKRCKNCNGLLVLLRHDGTISQWCGSCKLIYPIRRKCTYCGGVFGFDDLDFGLCDKIIEKIAVAEVCVEQNEKAIRKITRKHKRGEISDIDFQNHKQICLEEIVKCTKEAERLKHQREIGKPSETQTQKQ
jgi:hypothetical protein